MELSSHFYKVDIIIWKVSGEISHNYMKPHTIYAENTIWKVSGEKGLKFGRCRGKFGRCRGKNSRKPLWLKGFLPLQIYLQIYLLTGSRTTHFEGVACPPIKNHFVTHIRWKKTKGKHNDNAKGIAERNAPSSQELIERNLVTCSGNKIAVNKDYTGWRLLPRQVTVTK